MNTFLNWLAKAAEWAGDGDHFIGFVKLVAALFIVGVIVTVLVFVVINAIALRGIPG